METQQLHLYLAVALRTPDIRRACAAVERLHSALDLLDNLPEAALEEIRDHCDAYVKNRTGVFADFKRQYIALVADQLNEVRKTERMLLHGITGKGDAGYDETKKTA